MSNAPHLDFSVCVTRKECTFICTPTQTGTIGYGTLLGESEIGAKVSHNALSLQIENPHTLLSRSTKPVFVAVKEEGMNNITGIGTQRVEVIHLISQIPEHGNLVFSTTGVNRAIGRNKNGAHIAFMANKRVPELIVW